MSVDDRGRYAAAAAKLLRLAREQAEDEIEFRRECLPRPRRTESLSGLRMTFVAPRDGEHLVSVEAVATRSALLELCLFLIARLLRHVEEDTTLRLTDPRSAISTVILEGSTRYGSGWSGLVMLPTLFVLRFPSEDEASLPRERFFGHHLRRTVFLCRPEEDMQEDGAAPPSRWRRLVVRGDPFSTEHLARFFFQWAVTARPDEEWRLPPLGHHPAVAATGPEWAMRLDGSESEPPIGAAT